MTNAVRRIDGTVTRTLHPDQLSDREPFPKRGRKEQENVEHQVYRLWVTQYTSTQRIMKENDQNNRENDSNTAPA